MKGLDYFLMSNLDFVDRIEVMTSTKQASWHRLFSDRGMKKFFRSGEVIALQGEASGFVGFIISGRAKAVAFSEHGHATWVGHFNPDEFFGHISLLTGNHSQFEISAENDVEAIIISIDVMKDLLNKEDSLSQSLCSDLAIRLDHMTSRLIEAYSLSAKGRVCAELSRLSRVIGILPETLIIRPSPVFVELAERVNSTRETVSRTVSELQKKGVVRREAGALIINKPEALKAAIQ